MDKFWEWFHEKAIESPGVYMLHQLTLTHLPKQMLVGYMIEFCVEKNIEFTISNKSITITFYYLERKIMEKI